MNKKWNLVIRKIARIWSVVMIVLGVLIFIAHIFEDQSLELEPYPWWENLMPISMFIAILCLGLAWRWEVIGGALAVVFCLVNLLLYIATGREEVFAVLLITLPVLIPGLLFLIVSRRTNSNQPQQAGG